MENFDEFDKWLVILQNICHQNLHFEIYLLSHHLYVWVNVIDSSMFSFKHTPFVKVFLIKLLHYTALYRERIHKDSVYSYMHTTWSEYVTKIVITKSEVAVYADYDHKVFAVTRSQHPLHDYT